MTDLYKGIITFEEMEITAQTTKQELLKGFEGFISPASGRNIIYLLKLLSVDGTRFGITFTFNDDESISTLQLTPYIQYTSEKWDRTGRQEERRQFCDKWLLDRLGEPDLNHGGAEYKFDTVRISCVTHFDQYNGADAGYIVLTYLQ